MVKKSEEKAAVNEKICPGGSRLPVIDVLILISIIYDLFIFLTGGFSLEAGGLRFSSHDLRNPLIVTGILFLVRYFLNRGKKPFLLLRRDKVCQVCATMRNGIGRTVLKNWSKPIFLFLILSFIYLVNEREIGSGDTIPSRYLPFSIIKEGNLDLDEFPFLYEKESLYYSRYRNYYLRYSKGHYISAYPIGSAIAAVPVYAVAVIAGLSPQSEYLVRGVSKVSATLVSALSAVFLFLSLRRLTREKLALFIALIYGLGTSTWSVSSQGLWQHGSSQFFLTLTIYFLVRGLERRNYVDYAGFSLAFAVLCRLPNVLLTLPVAIYILHKYRDRLFRLILWSLPCLIFLISYNYRYFGSPFGIGYGGETSCWTTPFREGFLGVLISPSRGLLIYSPVLIFSFVGMMLAWRKPYSQKSSASLLLRYLSFGPILTILLHSKWFMWWGGHCFGPRLLADITPFLALFLYPVYERMRKSLRAVFVILVILSVGFHAIGAFLYYGTWNTNPNIDTHRERLWSWKDNQLLHYLIPLLPAGGEEFEEFERKQPISQDCLVGVHYYVWYPGNWGQGYLRHFLNPPCRPKLGEYSSKDLRVIEQHIAWSEEYGIDFWAIDWWPDRPQQDEVIKEFICEAKNIDKIKFCIFYESLARGFDKNLYAVVFDEEITRLFLSDLEYIARTYFNHPSYLKIDGRPVIILYATRSFVGPYKEAITLLRQRMRDLGFNIYLVGDEIFWTVRREDPLRVSHEPDVERMRLFDAITAYNMYDGSKSKQEGYVSSSTFFKDVVAKYREYKKIAEQNNIDFIPGIMPGFNDRGVRLARNHYVIPRQFGPGEPEGSLFIKSIERLALPFLDPDINMVLITSWNEWNEGTQIEPTILSPPTNSDSSESGEDYTQGYFYSGYVEKYLEIIRDKLGK